MQILPPYVLGIAQENFGTYTIGISESILEAGFAMNYLSGWSSTAFYRENSNHFLCSFTKGLEIFLSTQLVDIGDILQVVMDFDNNLVLFYWNGIFCGKYFHPKFNRKTLYPAVMLSDAKVTIIADPHEKLLESKRESQKQKSLTFLKELYTLSSFDVSTEQIKGVSLCLNQKEYYDGEEGMGVVRIDRKKLLATKTVKAIMLEYYVAAECSQQEAVKQHLFLQRRMILWKQNSLPSLFDLAANAVQKYNKKTSRLPVDVKDRLKKVWIISK